MHPIARACEIVGSQRALADAMGVTPAVVSQYLSGLRHVPPDRCIQIEAATSGAVRCEDLRPDIPWGVLRGTACECECAENPSRGDAAATQQEAA